MKDMPSKADMEEVGITLRERANIEGREGYPAYAAKLRGVADFLESLASEKDKPKVESLREAAARFRNRCEANPDEDAADLYALVLGRVDRLEELIQYEFVMSARTQGSLRQERAEIAQMRKGCAE